MYPEIIRSLSNFSYISEDRREKTVLIKFTRAKTSSLSGVIVKKFRQSVNGVVNEFLAVFPG